MKKILIASALCASMSAQAGDAKTCATIGSFVSVSQELRVGLALRGVSHTRESLTTLMQDGNIKSFAEGKLTEMQFKLGMWLNEVSAIFIYEYGTNTTEPAVLSKLAFDRCMVTPAKPASAPQP